MAIELEKKTHHSNLEHSKVMERNKNALAHEIEKLHSELINAEKRARASAGVAAAANAGVCLKIFFQYIIILAQSQMLLYFFPFVDPAHGFNYENTEVGFGGSPFPDPYTIHQVCFDRWL